MPFAEPPRTRATDAYKLGLVVLQPVRALARCPRAGRLSAAHSGRAARAPARARSRRGRQPAAGGGVGSGRSVTWCPVAGLARAIQGRSGGGPRGLRPFRPDMGHRPGCDTRHRAGRSPRRRTRRRTPHRPAAGRRGRGRAGARPRSHRAVAEANRGRAVDRRRHGRARAHPVRMFAAAIPTPPSGGGPTLGGGSVLYYNAPLGGYQRTHGRDRLYKSDGESHKLPNVEHAPRISERRCWMVRSVTPRADHCLALFAGRSSTAAKCASSQRVD